MKGVSADNRFQNVSGDHGHRLNTWNSNSILYKSSLWRHSTKKIDAIHYPSKSQLFFFKSNLVTKNYLNSKSEFYTLKPSQIIDWSTNCPKMDIQNLSWHSRSWSTFGLPNARFSDIADQRSNWKNCTEQNCYFECLIDPRDAHERFRTVFEWRHLSLQHCQESTAKNFLRHFYFRSKTQKFHWSHIRSQLFFPGLISVLTHFYVPN